MDGMQKVLEKVLVSGSETVVFESVAWAHTHTHRRKTCKKCSWLELITHLLTQNHRLGRNVLWPLRVLTHVQRCAPATAIGVKHALSQSLESASQLTTEPEDEIAESTQLLCSQPCSGI